MGKAAETAVAEALVAYPLGKQAVRLAVVGDIPRGQLEQGVAALAALLPRPPSDMAV